MAVKLHHGETVEKALAIIEDPKSDDRDLKRAELYLLAAGEVRLWFKNYIPVDERD